MQARDSDRFCRNITCDTNPRQSHDKSIFPSPLGLSAGGGVWAYYEIVAARHKNKVYISKKGS